MDNSCPQSKSTSLKDPESWWMLWLDNGSFLQECQQWTENPFCGRAVLRENALLITASRGACHQGTHAGEGASALPATWCWVRENPERESCAEQQGYLLTCWRAQVAFDDGVQRLSVGPTLEFDSFQPEVNSESNSRTILLWCRTQELWSSRGDHNTHNLSAPVRHLSMKTVTPRNTIWGISSG